MRELTAKELAQIRARREGIEAFRRELEDENAHIEDAVGAAVAGSFLLGYQTGLAHEDEGV